MQGKQNRSVDDVESIRTRRPVLRNSNQRPPSPDGPTPKTAKGGLALVTEISQQQHLGYQWQPPVQNALSTRAKPT